MQIFNPFLFFQAQSFRNKRLGFFYLSKKCKGVNNLKHFFIINGRVIPAKLVPPDKAVRKSRDSNESSDCKYDEPFCRDSDEDEACPSNVSFDVLLRMLCIYSNNHSFNQRLRTMGDLTMKDGFMNKYHKSIFEQATAHIDTTNNVLVAAVYLLTADFKLWKQTKNHVEKNRICFGRFKPVNCTETGYTVYSAAKDIYLGTKHFTLSDLADKNLIPPRLFEVICTAMSIKRYDVQILDRATRESS